jgi:hypothetical protein
MFQQQFSRIPDEMKTYRQFLCWRLEWQRDDWKHERKPTKIPYMLSGKFASVTDPSTWCSFDEAMTAKFGSLEPVEWAVPVSQSGFSGFGFVLTQNDPYCFIDLDDAHGDNLALERQFKIFSEFSSYSERSPSGKGLHIIIKASVPKGRRRSFVELYSNERYMTMTGDVYHEVPICERQQLANLLWEQLGGGVDVAVYDGNTPQTESDEEIIARARAAVNGPKFNALYDGEWQSFYGPQHGHDGTGHSEADFALIDILAFYTQNKEQIRRIFLASQLGKRPKALRTNYVEPMIMRAFDKLLPPLDIVGLKEQLELRLATDPIEKKWEALKPPQQLEAQPLLPGFTLQTESSHLNGIWPPGLLGQLAHFVYRSSPTPVPEIALTAAIGLMAGICGRCYNISGAGLNQYILCLAPTGSGKEAISTGISHLMNAVLSTQISKTASEFIGPGNIRSDAALLKWLAKNPSFVSIVGEFGLKLKQLSAHNANSHETGLRAVILDLYNKSGKGKQLNPMAYSDKEKNTAIVYSPAFTLLGESTPETFYNALDENMITEGLLPRFTILEYNGPQPPLNKGFENVKPEFRLVDDLAQFASQCLALNHDNRVIDVRLDDDATQMFEELREFARSQTNNADRDIVRQLWSRVNMKTLKLAALLAVGGNFFDPIITLQNAMWAKSLIISDVMNLLRRFHRGEIGRDSEESRQERVIKKACVEYFTKSYDEVSTYCQGDKAQALHAGKIIPATFISRKVSAMAAFRHDPRGVTMAIKRTIQNLVEADALREVPPSQLQAFGTRQKAYMVSDWGNLSSD